MAARATYVSEREDCLPSPSLSPTPACESSASAVSEGFVQPLSILALPEDLVGCSTSKRQSYTREEKLQILKFYYENGRNKYKTCHKYNIASASLSRWLRYESEIQEAKEGSKRLKGGGRAPFWPAMEAKLAEEFLELRRKGLSVKYYWFKARAHQLMTVMHPGVKFCFSEGWFASFKARHGITYKQPPTAAEKKQTHQEKTEIFTCVIDTPENES